MNDLQVYGIKSTASIHGHPIHPIIVVFPVAFLFTLPFIDLLYIISKNSCWVQTALWTVAAGFICGMIAAVSGFIDFVTIERTRKYMAGWVHVIGNVLAMIITLVNWILRVAYPSDSIFPRGFIISIVVAVLLCITGWAGGELAYRHGIGVTGEIKSS